MDASVELDRGREAYRNRAWQTAFEALSGADRVAPLDGDDLWRLAVSSHLVGRDEEFLSGLERAYHAHLNADASVRAARCAFWLGFRLADLGEMGRATGWLGRAARLVEREEQECVERGYLLLPVAHQHLVAGDLENAHGVAAGAAAIGERFNDADLLAFARHMEGIVRLRQARVDEGLALLDEAMVAVAGGELSPHVTGIIYCSVIGACRRVYALRRAHEWTAALALWCEQQTELVAYSGECLAYRAELLVQHGAWREAIEEADRACARLAHRGEAALGAAFYQRGEVHRLLGEYAAAEEAYRSASRQGCEPQPGLALLRLAQGSGDAAAAAIRRVLGETGDRLRRARLLPAHIEIVLALGHIDEAATACRELEEIARQYEADVLDTMVAHAAGAIQLAQNEPKAALIPLRRAWQGWQSLGAPYDAAQVRVLLGRACRALGDDDAAGLELDAARAVFEKLGAAPDVAAVDVLRRGEPHRRSHGLTHRELEVLALLATGRTNRAIAADLFISEKTVARHVSNIFTKLGLSSRSAATAYAYEHDLV